MELEYVLIIIVAISLLCNFVCAFFYIRNIKNIKLTSKRYDATGTILQKSKTTAAPSRAGSTRNTGSETAGETEYTDVETAVDLNG